MDKALELVGEWKVAFGAQANYKAIVDVFFELEKEGFHIPETQVSSSCHVLIVYTHTHTYTETADVSIPQMLGQLIFPSLSLL